MRLGRVLTKASAGVRWRGPFAWQLNNETRLYEFPWAYEQVTREGESLDILEIGGGLAGLQFVFAEEGHRVTNLDPGVTPPGAVRVGKDFSIDGREHQRLSRAFQAPVRLLPTTIADAGLPDDSFDVVLSVSALEHFTPEALEELEKHLVRVLRPTGVAVFTVDLFLDVAPFTSAEENRYGRNLDVRRFLDAAALRLEAGRPEQLLGFPEFDADRVQRDMASLLIGGYPALSQLFTARPRN